MILSTGPVPSIHQLNKLFLHCKYNKLNNTPTTVKAHFKLLVKIFKNPPSSATWYAVKYKCDVFLQILYVITKKTLSFEAPSKHLTVQSEEYEKERNLVPLSMECHGKACCRASKTALAVRTMPSLCQNHHVVREKDFFTNFCIVCFTGSCFS
jgi:hypothetical protein